MLVCHVESSWFDNSVPEKLTISTKMEELTVKRINFLIHSFLYLILFLGGSRFSLQPFPFLTLLLVNINLCTRHAVLLLLYFLLTC